MDFWQLQKSCLKKRNKKNNYHLWVTFMPFYQLEKISLHVHTALIYIFATFFALKKVIFKNFCFIIYKYVPKGFFHSYCYVYYTVGVSQMGHTVFLIPSSSPCFYWKSLYPDVVIAFNIGWSKNNLQSSGINFVNVK